jgi:hypothetical protein
VNGRCIHNTGASLGEPERGAFYSNTTVFNLDLGKLYPILGLGVFETVMLALVCDESERPNWLPVGVFEIDSTILPTDWEFAVLDAAGASGGDVSNRWVARWGYSELVHDERHLEELIQREPAALEIFSRELARRKLAERL